MYIYYTGQQWRKSSWNTLLPWGEKRYPSGASTLPTTYRYTGQRQESSLGPAGGEGLYYYGARWYDPMLGRFIQADTVVPGGVQGLDRYAYTNNNPINYTDPSGRTPCEDSFYGCKGAANTSRIDGSLSYWKWAIKSEFGVTLVDTGSEHGNGPGKTWDFVSARQVGSALGIANSAVNGKLKSLIGGSVFTLNGNNLQGHYHGYTGKGYIDFQTGGSFPSPYINIFHEVGHLINANSLGGNYYSTEMDKELRPWIDSEEKVDISILNSSEITDPWWKEGNGQDPLQGTNYSGTSSSEQWADTFANYVADNINVGKPAGNDMYNFVSGFFIP